MNYIYEIYFFKDAPSLLRHVAGNWELSGTNQFQSGAPFTIKTGDDFAGVGPGSGSQFWNQIASTDVAWTPFTSSATWFNKNAFAQPAPGTFGVQQRNALRNPGFWSWDAGIRKNIPVTESQTRAIRVRGFRSSQSSQLGRSQFQSPELVLWAGNK